MRTWKSTGLFSYIIFPYKSRSLKYLLFFTSPTYMEKFTPEVADVLGYLFQRFSKRWHINNDSNLRSRTSEDFLLIN